MAVEKMRFVNIAGKISVMDEFVIKSIVPFDIQFENAMYILDSVKGLYPFAEEVPYERLNKKVAQLISVLDHEIKYDSTKTCALMPVSVLEPEIDGYERQLETIQRISRSLKENLAHKREIRKQLAPMANLEIEVDRMFTFQYMKFRFGKMPKDGFEKLSGYIENLDVIAYKVSEEQDNVYLVYFTPFSQQGNIDSLFSSLFFERIRISSDVKGMPKDALKKIDEEIEELDNRINMLDKDSRGFVEQNFERLQELYNYTIELNQVFEVRHFAVRSKEAFYLTGWLPESHVKDFVDVVGKIPSVMCIFEDDDAMLKTEPPTRLINSKFFRPFEELVTMYGTPSYDEVDPTPFVGITYLLFFGMMFGDLGQGLIIALLGLVFYKKTKNNFGKLAVYLGITSSISGIFYGSVFGNEEVLRRFLPFIPMVNPMEVKLELLAAAIGFGVVLIIMAMILNMFNAYKKEKIGRLLFDRNGAAGMILFLSLIYIGLSTALGGKVSTLVVILLIIGPLLLIFLAHPLENLLAKKEHVFPEDRGGYFIEAFFELVETLLGIMSNSISFIRVGAFALNHVGFFLAFHAISDIVGGAGSVIVMIFGNLFIILLEGLIVAIQGLRLEYYELFSRFFEAEGIEFKPFKIKG